MSNTESKLTQLKGNVKETVGNATDQKDLEKEGKSDKSKGKIKETIDSVSDKTKDLVDKFSK